MPADRLEPQVEVATATELKPGAGVARDPHRQARRAQVALIATIGGFIILATVVAVKTPAWESNDEPSHVQNIETLASGHWYGMHYRAVGVYRVGSAGTEAHQAPLYYLILAGWQRLAGVSVRDPNPGPPNLVHLRPTRPGQFLHHSGVDLRFLLWLRVPNILFGAVTILVTFFAARLVTRDPWSPVIAAMIVGFLPRFVFLSAFVTNDNLANLLGALLTLLALLYVRRPTPWRMAAVGAIAGLLMITKVSALPLVAVLAVLALCGQGFTERVQRFAIGVASFIAVCGWFLVQNIVRYGSPLATSASERYLLTIGGLGTPFGVPYLVHGPLRYVFIIVPQSFLDRFWYGSGWGEVFQWPWPVGLLFWGALGLALVGLIKSRSPGWVLAVLATVATTGLVSVWIVAFQTATYDPRLALVGMPSLACLAALGLERRRLLPRFLLPALCLGGTLFALETNVLAAVHWSV